MKPSSIRLLSISSLWVVPLLALPFAASILAPVAAEAGWRDRAIIEEGWEGVPRPPRFVGEGWHHPATDYAEPDEGEVYEPDDGAPPDEVLPEDEQEPKGYSQPDDYPEEGPPLNTQASRGTSGGPAVVPGLAPPPGKARPARSAGIAPAKLLPPKLLPAEGRRPPRAVPAKASPLAPSRVIDAPASTASVGAPVSPKPGSVGKAPTKTLAAATVALPVKRPSLEVVDFAPAAPGKAVSEDRR